MTNKTLNEERHNCNLSIVENGCRSRRLPKKLIRQIDYKCKGKQLGGDKIHCGPPYTNTFYTHIHKINKYALK